jgi:MATE family multidrug resistance protein
VGQKPGHVTEGGAVELLRLAGPLILSNSFLTLQLTIDRILLSQSSSDAVGASVPAMLLYWTPFALLQNTVNYATTFVAQYTGAGRPERVGPAVWQALYVAVCGGILFLFLRPLATWIVAMGGHEPTIQALEVTYFQCLCFAALPALIVQAVNSFFAGRGDSWTVLIIDGTGLTVNAVLAYAWIFGHFGFPALGIAGAGLATVVGSSSSAFIGLSLFFRQRFRSSYATVSGWRVESALFRRLMRYGVPNGLQWMLDGLSFTFFLFLVGRLGKAELAATNIAIAINLMALVPMLGIGQAVAILVGQRLGQDRPEIAARSTWCGFGLANIYIGTLAVLYFAFPSAFFYFFRNESDPLNAALELYVPPLLQFVAVYALFDSMNITFSFALRGAGDTRFVTLMVLVLAWPLMVFPTWLTWFFGAGLEWPWLALTIYVIALGIMFIARFRAGKWKKMRVIETIPEADATAVQPASDCDAASIPVPSYPNCPS